MLQFDSTICIAVTKYYVTDFWQKNLERRIKVFEVCIRKWILIPVSQMGLSDSKCAWKRSNIIRMK